MEKSKRVETYEVRLYCDECGEEMKEVTLVLLCVHSLQHMHITV